MDWKTRPKRTGPKPDIRDIIGRWGEGSARRLRAGCCGRLAQCAGTADVSSRGSFPSASPSSSVPTWGKLQRSSSIRRSRLRHTTRCSSRPVASLVMGWCGLCCSPTGCIREGLPMSREPALLTSAGRMPERSQHRVSEGRMPKANVRRRDMGSPEPCCLRRGFFQEDAHLSELLVAFRHELVGRLGDQASE